MFGRARWLLLAVTVTNILITLVNIKLVLATETVLSLRWSWKYSMVFCWRKILKLEVFWSGTCCSYRSDPSLLKLCLLESIHPFTKYLLADIALGDLSTDINRKRLLSEISPESNIYTSHYNPMMRPLVFHMYMEDGDSQKECFVAWRDH